MKKFLKNITIIIMSLIIPANVSALSTEIAKEGIDLNKDCSLVITYDYNDYKFDETNVEIYYVASVTSDFKYQLSSNFIDYPIKINGIITNNEWNILEQTLDAYITADNITPTIEKNITDNKVILNKITPGLYYIKTAKIDTSDYTLMFDNFLISVPDLNEDGTWNYDVKVYPKAEEFIRHYEKITYTVLKQWIDDGVSRPKSVDIEIYEDGKLIEKQVLSNENNWTYSWTTDDDGSIWHVVERNISESYNVSIKKQDKNFIIINTDPNYREDNPSTGDNIKIYFYLLISSLLGFILLIISLGLTRRNS